MEFDQQTKELIDRNCRLPLYFLLPNTVGMNSGVENLKYTTSKSAVGECLMNLGLVFELKDGKFEPVTSITVP